MVGYKETTESKSELNKVLVVDSNLSLTTEIASALTKAGFEMMVAVHKSTDVTLIHECLPDIIIVTDNPPQLDGFMFCREIHYRFTLLPVILLGNRPETQVYSQNLETPPDWDYYMRLPIDYNELAARIKVLLCRYGKGEKPWLSEKLANLLMPKSR